MKVYMFICMYHWTQQYFYFGWFDMKSKIIIKHKFLCPQKSIILWASKWLNQTCIWFLLIIVKFEYSEQLMNMWCFCLWVLQCKNLCKNHAQGNKNRIYQENGSFCRNCDYYFEKWFIRCPCCNAMVRHSTRNRKDQDLLLRIRWEFLS